MKTKNMSIKSKAHLVITLGALAAVLALVGEKYQNATVYKEGECFLRINRERKTVDHGLVKVASKSGYGVLLYFTKESEENNKAAMATYVVIPSGLEDNLDIIKVDCKYSVFEKALNEN